MVIVGRLSHDSWVTLLSSCVQTAQNAARSAPSELPARGLSTSMHSPSGNYHSGNASGGSNGSGSRRVSSEQAPTSARSNPTSLPWAPPHNEEPLQMRMFSNSFHLAYKSSRHPHSANPRRFCALGIELARNREQYPWPRRHGRPRLTAHLLQEQRSWYHARWQHPQPRHATRQHLGHAAIPYIHAWLARRFCRRVLTRVGRLPAPKPPGAAAEGHDPVDDKPSAVKPLAPGIGTDALELCVVREGVPIAPVIHANVALEQLPSEPRQREALWQLPLASLGRPPWSPYLHQSTVVSQDVIGSPGEQDISLRCFPHHRLTRTVLPLSRRERLSPHDLQASLKSHHNVQHPTNQKPKIETHV